MLRARCDAAFGKRDAITDVGFPRCARCRRSFSHAATRLRRSNSARRFYRIRCGRVRSGDPRNSARILGGISEFAFRYDIVSNVRRRFLYEPQNAGF
ncbi:hypothetical protein DBV15_07085 [Temnothorax longispinosus]|uniref:Uncharacterized protein n=1 Tax=Temnothorax longispinosus TaxID=300112 RepID=A0A4S2KRU1_9HYME|nr:hypothetical protein DBV15_07085 [Temnothorax longispinosus]